MKTEKNIDTKNILDLPVGETLAGLSLEEQIIALKDEVKILKKSKKKAQTRYDKRAITKTLSGRIDQLATTFRRHQKTHDYSL